MRDEETGSWWQQISGEAIQGSMKGSQLVPVETDELTFGTWKRENPDGRVLKPDARISIENYDSNWETEVARMPVRVTAKLDETLEPRTLIVGLSLDGNSKAYPFTAIEKQSPILDMIGTTPVVVVLGEDGRSVRAFSRIVDGRKLEFLKTPDTNELVDAETASGWDFTGTSIRGPLTGKQLTKIQVIKDYWFDWKTYHPKTQLYSLGAR